MSQTDNPISISSYNNETFQQEQPQQNKQPSIPSSIIESSFEISQMDIVNKKKIAQQALKKQQQKQKHRPNTFKDSELISQKNKVQTSNPSKYIGDSIKQSKINHNNPALNHSDIKRKVSDIIQKKSFIDSNSIHMAEEQEYNQEFDQEISNQVKSQVLDGSRIIEDEAIENQAVDDEYIADDLSQEVISQVVQSNDPQLALFNKTDRKSPDKKTLSNFKNNEVSNRNKQKNLHFLKNAENENNKQKKSKQKQKSNVLKKVQDVVTLIPKKQIHVSSNGKSSSGLTAEQIQRHNQIKEKKIKQQEEKLRKQQQQKDDFQAHKQQKQKEIAQKMKKLAEQNKTKLKKLQLEQKKKKQQQKANQRGASRNKHRSQKKKGQAVSNSFIQDDNQGDNAMIPGAQKQVDAVSIAAKTEKTQLSVMNRIKNNLVKKKQFDKKIQAEIVQKINKLKQDPKQLKSEQIKQLRKQLKQDEKKYKMQPLIIQKKQKDTTQMKQLKAQMKELRKERMKLKQRVIQQERIKARQQQKIKAIQKQQNIIVLDQAKRQYTSFGLVRDLKVVNKTIKVNQVVQEQHLNVSSQTPIQKFTNYFFKQNYQQTEIFNILNVNDDDVLTMKEIQKVCKQLNIGLTDRELKQIFKILDYDSSGALSKDEFQYVVGKQLQSKTNLKKILGKIDVQNPIEIEERILDMRARIKFMQKFIQQHSSQIQSTNYIKLAQKIQRYEERLSKRKQNNKLLPLNITFLRQQMRLLETEKENEQRIGGIVKQQIQRNLKGKSQLLKNKVEEQLLCRQKLYQSMNEFQQKQLRYITIQKIKQTKLRYAEQQDAHEKQKQAALRQATQYKNSIINKKNMTEVKSTDDQMRLLAATLMIQRNFRKKKAMKELQKLKEQKRQQKVKQ